MPKATAGASDSHWPHFFELGLHLPQNDRIQAVAKQKKVAWAWWTWPENLYISLKNVLLHVNFRYPNTYAKYQIHPHQPQGWYRCHNKILSIAKNRTNQRQHGPNWSSSSHKLSVMPVHFMFHPQTYSWLQGSLLSLILNYYNFNQIRYHNFIVQVQSTVSTNKQTNQPTNHNYLWFTLKIDWRLIATPPHFLVQIPNGQTANNPR